MVAEASMPSEPLITAGFVGENVAEQVLGERPHRKLVGAVTRRMAQASTYSVLELHVGILFAQQRDDLAPELRGFEHVGFVDRGDFLAALACQFKRDVGDALDLRRPSSAWC